MWHHFLSGPSSCSVAGFFLPLRSPSQLRRALRWAFFFRFSGLMYESLLSPTLFFDLTRGISFKLGSSVQWMRFFLPFRCFGGGSRSPPEDSSDLGFDYGWVFPVFFQVLLSTNLNNSDHAIESPQVPLIDHSQAGLTQVLGCFFPSSRIYLLTPVVGHFPPPRDSVPPAVICLCVQNLDLGRCVG